MKAWLKTAAVYVGATLAVGPLVLVLWGLSDVVDDAPENRARYSGDV